MNFLLLEPGFSEFFASSQPISKLATSNPAKRTNMMATKMATVGSGSLAYLSVLCVSPSLIVPPICRARPWPGNRRSPGAGMIDLVAELVIGAPGIVGADPLLHQETVKVRVDLHHAEKAAFAVLLDVRGGLKTNGIVA